MGGDAAAAIAGLEALKARVSDATRQSAADALHMFQAAGMAHAPVGVSGNSTNAPGDLRRSIIVEGPHTSGPDVWSGQVGPTTVYGRQRELGGPIFPKNALALRFVKFGTTWIIGPEVIPGAFGSTIYMDRPGVYQHPRPYMLAAYMEVKPALPGMVEAHMAEAIKGV